MNTLTNFFNPFWNDSADEAKYEVIENDVLSSRDFKELTISGSLFSLTTFKNITFESCVFFGSRMENCNFVNCTFKNCEFKFSTIEHCNLKGSIFEDCTWYVAPFRKNLLEECILDVKTDYYANKESNQNKLVSCSNHKDVVSAQDEPASMDTQEDKPELPPIPTEEEVAIHEQVAELWARVA